MFINGEKYDYNDISVNKLLESLEVEARALVVEVNSVIVHKKQYDEMILKKDDKVEIVSFVGGG